MNKQSIESLRNQLNLEFNLICFEDLADFFSNHSTIYIFLANKRKEQFLNNDRLVFYTSNCLTQEFVNHIQKALAEVNIGNFFVTIVSKTAIDNELQRANKLFCNDATLITHLMREIEDTKPFENQGFISFHETFCALPFTQSDISMVGSVKTCCKSTEILGDVNNQKVKEIFHGDKFNELREAFKRGEKSPSCINCWDLEAKGSKSYRILSLGKFRNYINFKDVFNSPKLVNVHFQAGNLCNFKCRICGPKNSSSIISEELRHTNDSNTIKNLRRSLSLNKSITKEVTDNIIKDLEGVEYLHLAGGEPLLWPSLFYTLDTLIDSGFSKNIILEFSTNCSIFSKELLDKANEFKQVEMALSIDDIYERFEIQRGGSWDKIYKNILSYKDNASSNTHIKVITTVNIQNLLYLNEIYNFFKQLNIPVIWWPLEEPEVLSIDRVTNRVKELVIKLYQNHPDPELQALSNRMKLTKPVSGRDFINYCNKFDLRRNQNFQRSHKQIYDAMMESNSV